VTDQTLLHFILAVNTMM